MRAHRLPPPSPSAPAGRARMAGMVSVVGAVCGTLVAETLGSSPGWNLLGAILGAALPPIISAAGPGHRVRAATGIAITAAALLFTYSGFTLFAYAAEQQAVFPIPDPLPNPAPPTTRHTSPNLGKAGIAITPERGLTCTTASCPQPVTIHSVGTAALAITKIELNGDNAADFHPGGPCANRTLQPGGTCIIDITFNPSGANRTRHAQLMLWHNASNAPSQVDLHGTIDPPRIDLAAPTAIRCSVTTSREVQLRLQFRILITGGNAAQIPQRVTVTLTSPSGLETNHSAAPGTPTEHTTITMTVVLKPGQLGQRHTITLAVDPNNEINERDENNNTATIGVVLPAEPRLTAPIACNSR